MDGYVQGGAAKARQIWEKNRLREKELEPAALAQHLDGVEKEMTKDDEYVQRISQEILEKQSDNAKILMGIGESASMSTQQEEVKALREAESASG